MFCKLLTKQGRTPVSPGLVKWLVGSALISACFSAAADTTVIHAGQLFDAETAEVLENRSIEVADGRIVAVHEGFVSGDREIDLKSAFVMPGWIDMHVHIATEQSPGRYVERFTLNPADYALRATGYAERTLHAGFTTVRDLGTSAGLAQSLRDAIRKGWIIGPRIFTAGKGLGTTGGHADPSNGRNDALAWEPTPVEGVVDSVDDARRAVRARYKERADLVKITATGGVLSPATSGQNPQFTQAEIEAIVATAKDYGFKVAAHAHGAEGMKRAVLAGVDSIEHGTLMSEEVMRLMRRKGTWYVPTIIAGKFVAEKAKIDGYFPEIIRPKAAEIGPQIQGTFAKAYALGVPIVFGTDTGVSPHGDNWKEFLYMEEAGMPIVEALKSATHSAALLLGKWEELGSITPGKHADIVAVPGDPREDSEVLGSVHFVMKGGRIYKSL